MERRLRDDQVRRVARANEGILAGRGKEGYLLFEVKQVQHKRWKRMRIDTGMFELRFSKEGADDDQIQFLIHSQEAVDKVRIDIITKFF